VVYIVVSLLTPKPKVNMDKLLHRGAFSDHADSKSKNEQPVKGWKVLAWTKEFTRGDKIIYAVTIGWTLLWVLVFIVGTIYNFAIQPIENSQWLQFWKIYTYIFLGISIIVTIWFTIGGIKNLREMIAALRSNLRDHSDDGFVKREE